MINGSRVQPVVRSGTTTRSITPNRFRRRCRRVRGRHYDNAGNPGLRRGRRLTDSRALFAPSGRLAGRESEGASEVGGPYTYTYNKAGRLKTVTVGGTVRGTYVYNGFEQLISRVVTNSGTANGTTYFVHDPWGNVIAELTTAGATVREYIWRRVRSWPIVHGKEAARCTSRHEHHHTR